MTTDATAQTTPEFVISRHFAAPPERLWEAWTDPAQMAQWLGPKGTTGTTLAADVRPGGLLHWRMDGAEGSMWGRAVYREVIAPSRLVYVQSFSDDAGAITRAPFFEGRWPLEMLTIVTFELDGDGTRVTLTWRPLDAAADELANFVSNIPSMHGGWGNSFDQLAALIDQG
ncbi:SRPBCC domain-containing protein [Sphingomonas sp. RT2P30]|uniref:SRPBCC family protein n=1 Tax=Parasphingomonas halimpatiens TaxID=3096162 RepID=UPI002FCA117D